MLSTHALISSTYLQEMPLSTSKKEEFINAASAFFTSACGVDYSLQTNTEYYDTRENYTEDLILNNYPVSSIVSISVNGTDLETTDYYVDEKNGIVTILNGLIWQNNVPGSIEIVYVSGYALGSAPYDMQNAVKQIVTALFKGQTTEDQNTAVSIGPICQATIDKYKRIV